ncbi:trigger factor [Lichenihabitans psoromatis]|uniref:trigger factor n=1 Tax=Lichenihabitans psoromatis TaxID=2528642 RepID=UPI001036DA36|nr:trigger factor [Lichenihabitans psoromatis]
MQVTEVSSQGLKREYKVVLPAADLASRLEGELAGMRDKVKINGFRPGKVPMAHLKRVYGRSVMSEVVQNAVNEANRKIVEDNGLRLAMEPKIDLASDQAEVERAMEAEGDLSFTVAVETLPKFETGTFETIEIERLVAEVDEAEVTKSMERMADQNRVFTPKEGDDATAENGDKLTIDFEGKIKDEVFEGGAGKDIDVILGSDSFIPGFEAQLVGAKLGEERKVALSFPENYLSAQLAGQAATFDVTVKSIAAPGELKIDDDFAKNFGFDDLDGLKTAVRSRMEDEFSKASRDKLKRALLDQLDKRYSFDLPQGLVEQEFANIWRQVSDEQQKSGRSFADDDTTEDDAKAEYRRIAERRVRLGLVLAEVGESTGVKVGDDEITKALVEMVRQYPGQEKEVWEFYRKTPQALAEIRAPLFEEKVVDYIVTQAKVTDRTVSREELFKVEAGDNAMALPRSDAWTEDAPEASSDENDDARG